MIPDLTFFSFFNELISYDPLYLAKFIVSFSFLMATIVLLMICFLFGIFKKEMDNKHN